MASQRSSQEFGDCESPAVETYAYPRRREPALDRVLAGGVQGASDPVIATVRVTRNTFQNSHGVLGGGSYLFCLVCMVAGAWHIIPAFFGMAGGTAAGMAGYQAPASAPGYIKVSNAIGQGAGVAGAALLVGAGQVSAGVINASYVPTQQSAFARPARISGQPFQPYLTPIPVRRAN